MDWKKPVEALPLQAHQHDIIYYGVVNLVHESKIIGTVDVWRCRSCDEIFCEDKRFGATDLAPEVGFPKVEAGSRWAALVCTRNNASDWTLTGVKPGGTLVHSCTPKTKLELHVGPDYTLEPGPLAGIGQHRVILLENFVNSAVDVLTGQKHAGTTDAYQALGKPFSFTPPLSAAVVESSRLQVFNITAGLFVLTGVWGLLGGTMMLGYQELGLRTFLAGLSVACFACGYLVFRKSYLGSLAGPAAALAGIAVFTILRLPSASFGIVDFATYGLLLISLGVGWVAWNRIRGLRASKWHPLDMPAYG